MSPGASPAAEALAIGERVRVDGLVKRADRNGHEAKLSTSARVKRAQYSTLRASSPR